MKKLILYSSAIAMGAILAIFSHHVPAGQSMELRMAITKFLI